MKRPSKEGDRGDMEWNPSTVLGEGNRQSVYHRNANGTQAAQTQHSALGWFRELTNGVKATATQTKGRSGRELQESLEVLSGERRDHGWRCFLERGAALPRGGQTLPWSRPPAGQARPLLGARRQVRVWNHATGDTGPEWTVLSKCSSV